MSNDATIFALGTAQGRAGIAVVRVSGPAAAETLRAFTGALPAPRRAVMTRIADPATNEALDRGLVLYFPGPGSYSGEDMAEFQVHGGAAVIAGLLAALGRRPGLRLAEPGEFTRRAFANGRMDLAEAEGVADLIQAETEAQRIQALAQTEGAFGRATESWIAQLLRAAALLEACIDFADEDVPEDAWRAALTQIEAVAHAIDTHLADGRRGEILRDGLSVAILGPPNSGKSSLLNALAGRDAAIVSATAGTTRDIIECHLDLGGYPVILADTAGIRASIDAIETEGVRRAEARARAAELRLLVLDATAPAQLAEFESWLEAEPALLVWNKADLLAPGSVLPRKGVQISALTGAGLDTLLAAMTAQAAARLSGPPALVTRTRHRAALEECRAALTRLFHVKQEATEIELLAEELRLARRALARIGGKVDVEALLDVVFREFCIGK